MLMPVVVLTDDDEAAAASEAAQQMERKREYGRSTDHGGSSKRGTEQRLADTKFGLMGEIALARYLDRPWTPGGIAVSRGDVSNFIEVRATQYSSGHLLIYQADKDRSWFALVIGRGRRFKIAGAILCRTAKLIGRWHDDADPPCFWIAQAQLISTDKWKRNRKEDADV